MTRETSNIYTQENKDRTQALLEPSFQHHHQIQQIFIHS
uniref:Uncharacterized protein n=1 Tax=Anguilla anguilla TaxID=7936 RepID=A0A0E9WHP6_ANGAN